MCWGFWFGVSFGVGFGVGDDVVRMLAWCLTDGGVAPTGPRQESCLTAVESKASWVACTACLVTWRMVTNKRIEMITAVTTSGNKSRHRKDKGCDVSVVQCSGGNPGIV